MDFIETHTKGMETLGFWTEEYRSVVIGMMETRYKTEIIREWTIGDLVFNVRHNSAGICQHVSEKIK